MAFRRNLLAVMLVLLVLTVAVLAFSLDGSSDLAAAGSGGGSRPSAGIGLKPELGLGKPAIAPMGCFVRPGVVTMGACVK